ncbi:DUF6470 family protein [Paenibacillus dokdonensis]|uniref:DUF6470 family protein n=1 Tax=Paenibacillus dokdonensis TaxID=2567944 RepID=A0ABU6GNU5_9BACL|nr:DUF6470 family protein [Paenibacillus dokdonensis]MEC0241416.1 DUF6470 family protein [Paenibacillus dokdonensis]
MQPILQIRQTPALIGIDADLGQYSIRQPKADVSMTTTPSELEIHQYQPELHVDQTMARSAFTGGNFIDMNARIYSGIQDLYLQGIARRVEEGNRAAAIHIPGNTIADIYGEDWQPVPFPEFRTPASMDNVDIRIDTRPPDIQFRKATTDMQVEVRRPEIEYTRGKLDIYMKQYASVQYIPPELDTRR